MLVSAFKLEKLYKKNRLLIWATIAAIVLFFGGKAVMGAIEESKLNSANEAYLTLIKDPSNQAAAATLQEKNPELYELYSYKQAMDNKDIEKLKTLSSSANEMIADISRYHLAILENREAKSKYYNEIAIINNANLLIRQGKIEEAKAALSQIAEDSPMHKMALLMKHYTIKGK